MFKHEDEYIDPIYIAYFYWNPIFLIGFKNQFLSFDSAILLIELKKKTSATENLG